MAEDTDADRILKEREQRRAHERARIEEEHLRRQEELDRLRSFGLEDSPRPIFESTESYPAPLIVPSLGRADSSESDAADKDEAGPDRRARAPREIGHAVRPPIVNQFLQTDPMERFDIHALNMMPFSGVLEAARDDPELQRLVTRQADALMGRVKRELDDHLSAGAFLRDHVLRWYRESPGDPAWAERTPEQWAGLFAESRVSGGRLVPWLNLRLWSLREHVSRSGSLRLRLARGLTREKKAEALVARTPGQQIRAEVAQALLDDLAARARSEDGTTPLVRLSELAVRREVLTVNDALAQFFSGPESGPFVLLHPNRYPDCEEVMIRPPTAGTTGAALAYSLVAGRPGRRAASRGHGTPAPDLAPVEPGGEVAETDEPEELDASTIWEAIEVPPEAWKRVVKERRRERRRLDPPPKDCRTRAAYPVLRELLLDDPEVRQGFASVKWRGRPSGLPLLATLLHKGSLSPEVATDYEYLETELGDLVEGDPHWRPPDGSWSTHGWSIVRQGTHSEGFRFVAKQSA